jgi:hypothetical protein
MKTKFKLFLIFPVFIVLLASCSNTEILEPCFQGQTYNFWWGLWHGLIAPINLVAMLFRDDISVFAPNNNGAWYAFGFLLGSGGWGVFGGKSICRKK